MFKRLSEIISQDKAVELLRSALLANHLPHAMIFAGPSGVGKRTTAQALAEVLLCQNAPTPALPGSTALAASRSTRGGDEIEACGKCESCRLLAAGNHPDFHLVYRQLIRIEKEESKARELAADVIRKYLIDPANHRAAMNHGKVFVVEEADLMNASAQNTLLKTLEEPPDRTFIILLTDQPEAMLSTIRSRCQIIPFGPIDQQVLIKQLKERKIADPEDAALFAEGSLGLAIQWSEDGVIAQAAELRKQIAHPQHLGEWLKKAAEAYAAKQLERDSLSSKDQATHDGLAIYLRIASLILRQMLKAEQDEDRLERLCQAIEAIAGAEANLQANVNVSLALMQLSMTMDRELVR